MRTLKISRLLIEAALLLNVFVLGFALQRTLMVFAIVGLFEDAVDVAFYLAWPMASLTALALALAEFRFVPQARRYFNDPSHPVTMFGHKSDEVERSLIDVRISLNRYAIFLLAPAFLLLFFIGMPFVNVLISVALLILQIGLRHFLQHKARLLKDDEELLG